MASRVVGAAVALVLMAAAAATVAASVVPHTIPAGIPERRIIGFSENGAYFALETYGIDEDSGSPFAEILIIATASNEIVSGSPFRAALWGVEWGEVRPMEQGLIDEVRSMVLDLGRSTLQRLGVLDQGDIGQGIHAEGNPGWVLVANAVPEIATTAEFTLRPSFPLPRRGMTLTVTDVPLPAPAYCGRNPEGYAGIGLALRDWDGTLLLEQRETTVPEERGCPAHYTIRDLIIHEAAAIAMLVLNVYSPGFEGERIRFAALAFPL